MSSQAVFAETYQGIKPLSTLADVKAKYPNATFRQNKPAWAQEDDIMYSITGVGISGEIIIKFVDLRPTWTKRSEDERVNKKIRELYAELAAGDVNESLCVDWVRWVPDSPFPIGRLIAKYGKPEKSGFADDDFSPYTAWSSKGVYAHLSDDGKRVIFVDFTFTEKEIQADGKKK
jgi:hypothetical protein